MRRLTQGGQIVGEGTHFCDGATSGRVEVRVRGHALRIAFKTVRLVAGQLLTRSPSCFLTARRMSSEPEASTSRIARDRASPPTIAANMRTARS